MHSVAPSLPQAAPSAGLCPMHRADAAEDRALQPQDVLVFPMHRRAVVQRAPGESGNIELFIYYFDKEVSFDEPDLFAFGEALVEHERFTAIDALGWGTGYTWERIAPLLEHLLAEDILEHEDPSRPPQRRPLGTDGAQPSPLPPARTTEARTWQACEEITRELTGHPVEPGHLELLIPVFRIAHMALDAEGRQVGEANVFPAALRLDVPTRWRTCIYAGSRYLDSRPMNVTALKTMRAHWTPLLAVLAQLREAYLRRFPAARAGWTVGDLERLSTLVLAVPTYALVRGDAPVANGALHPVLSCLFRVTDGLRMTTHQMLFVPVAEATLETDSPITAREVYAYAERNHAFASNHGVCAGPQAMIEEFLAVLVDGADVPGAAGLELDAQVQRALQDVEQAFDYGLLGLQAHVAVFSQWPVMTRAYAQMHAIAQAWHGTPNAAMRALQEHLQQKDEILRRQTLHATEAWRDNRQRVYADIYAHCAAGLDGAAQDGLAAAMQRLARPAPAARVELRAHLQARLGDGSAAQQAGVDRLVDALWLYFTQAQALLAVATQLQSRINRLLGRADAQRPFTALDIDVHVQLQDSEARRLPHLLAELQALLGCEAHITGDAIDIAIPITTCPHAAARGGSTPFAGKVPADHRA